VDAKMERSEYLRCTLPCRGRGGWAAVVKRSVQRSRKAIETMLRTSPDVELLADRFAIDLMLAAISGVMRSALESEATPARSASSKSILWCFANPIWRPR